MENNLILEILSKANSRDKNKSGVYSEMIDRHFSGADAFGKRQIDKILMNLTGIGLDNLYSEVESNKPNVVIEARLAQPYSHFDEGICSELITTPEGKYGLIKHQEEQIWSYFIEPENPLKFDCEDYHQNEPGYLYIPSVETLQLIVNLMSMGSIRRLPAKI